MGIWTECGLGREYVMPEMGPYAGCNVIGEGGSQKPVEPSRVLGLGNGGELFLGDGELGGDRGAQCFWEDTVVE